MALSLAQAQELADLATGLGVDVEVRPDYSGRCMYGDTVVAFVADEPARALVALGFAAAQILEGEPDGLGPIGSTFSFRDLPSRMDSMGLGTVIY